MLVLRKRISELLLSPTTSEKKTWSETTVTKRYYSGLDDCGGGRGRRREIPGGVECLPKFYGGYRNADLNKIVAEEGEDGEKLKEELSS